MKLLLLFITAILFAAKGLTQVSITDHNIDITTNLSGWGGSLPSGFSHSGATTYRGTSATLTSGGSYSVEGSGYGYQPSSSASSLTLTATFQNNTGSVISELEISYEAFKIYHRTSRIPTWSVTSSLGVPTSELNWTYNSSSSAESPDLRSMTIEGLAIPNGGTFTLSFSSNRGSGSGSTPKIGVNNITVHSVNTPCVVEGTDVQTACSSYLWIDGETYTESTDEPTFNLEGAAEDGCDSLVTLNLTILEPAIGVDEQTACESFEWIDGETYTESTDEPTFNIAGGAANGCDSLVTLNLTILSPSTGTDVQTACETFEWIDGETYTESTDEPTFLIEGGAINGCDSLVTLNLTILEPTTGTDVQTACGSYEWIDGIIYTESTDEAMYNLEGMAVNGCDSLVTLNLTILEPAAGVDEHEACKTFTWINGVTYTESNDVDTYTIDGGAANGCDSVVTLNLIINTVNTEVTVSDPSIDANLAGATYQWLDCAHDYAEIEDATEQNFTASENGIYAVKITDDNSCVDTSLCITIATVGIEHFKTFEQVLIYPNPSHGQFTIEIDDSEAVQVSIYAITRELIYQELKNHETNFKVDLGERKGMFVIELTTSTKRHIQRIVVE